MGGIVSAISLIQGESTVEECQSMDRQTTRKTSLVKEDGSSSSAHLEQAWTSPQRVGRLVDEKSPYILHTVILVILPPSGQSALAGGVHKGYPMMSIEDSM